MAHDVFISYTTRDTAIADAVCHALEERHIRCWIAPRDVSAGLSWKAAIVGAIRNAQVMVLIFSGEVNSSKDVRREVDIAFEERRPIIPFRIENVAPSDELYYCIADRHWLDALTPPVEQHIGGLVTALRRFIAEPERAPVTETVAEAAVPEPLAPPDAVADDEPLAEAIDAVEDAAEPNEAQAPPTPLMGAMTPARLAIAAVGFAAVIVAGVWAGGAGKPVEPPKTGVDFYDAGRFAEALPLLTKEADAGSADAQARLAEMYLDGRGVEKDATLGLSFLTRAASGGNADAASRLGLLYEQGTGVSRDLREAMRWHSRAASHGVVRSQCAAALLALNGEGGVPRDYDTAAKWYGSAAGAGAVCGQLGAGYLSYQGYGLPKNYDEAMRLWELADKQGDPTAKENIQKVQAGWVLPPLFAGDWTAVIGDERRAEIARVKAANAGFADAAFQRMRRLPFDLYEGGSVIEVEIAVSGQPPGVFSYLRLPDLMVPITGKTDQFAALNGKSMRLDTPARIAQRVRLGYCSMQDDAHRFRLVEHVRPLEITGNPKDGWIGRGLGQMRMTVAEWEFRVAVNGETTVQVVGTPTAAPPGDADRFHDNGLRRPARVN